MFIFVSFFIGFTFSVKYCVIDITEHIKITVKTWINSPELLADDLLSSDGRKMVFRSFSWVHALSASFPSQGHLETNEMYLESTKTTDLLILPFWAFKFYNLTSFQQNFARVHVFLIFFQRRLNTFFPKSFYMVFRPVALKPRIIYFYDPRFWHCCNAFVFQKLYHLPQHVEMNASLSNFSNEMTVKIRTDENNAFQTTMIKYKFW